MSRRWRVLPVNDWRVLSGRARVETVSALRFRAYDLVQRAGEEGVNIGLNRAFKHTEPPSREQRALIAESVEREVMGALCEILVEAP